MDSRLRKNSALLAALKRCGFQPNLNCGNISRGFSHGGSLFLVQDTFSAAFTEW